MVPLSFNAGLCGLVVLLVALLFRLFVWRVLTSPLRRVPCAHWSCSVSSAWILWTRYRGRELAVVTAKHRQLGPIVRLGPADLSISCYDDGIRTIYNGGFEKPGYYDFFSYYEQKNAFCSLSRQEHMLRRKRITAAYTKTSLFASESLSSLTQAILYQRLLPLVQHHAQRQEPTDILSLSYGLSLDLLTAFQFGLCSASNFVENPAALQVWNRHYEERYCKEAFWPQELPSLTRCLGRLGIEMLPKSQAEASRYLEDWLLALCNGAERVCLAAEREPVSRANVPVVYQLVKKGVQGDMANEGAEAKRRAIASELFDQMSGGREVLGLVLAYTIYYLSQHPVAQTKLRAELATLQPSMHHSHSPQALPPPQSLDTLPYLSAILKESLRMRPTSTPLPRVTPRDRAVSLAGIAGIPPGTRVNAFQWLVHRNPDNYANVDEWEPDRWLQERKDGRGLLLWPFGGGSRMCVGVSLTHYLMRYILAILYSNFTSRVVSKKSGDFEPGSTEDEILLQFEPL
ncbi:hypothetical protein CDD81_2586 [Ophiocordyceps australis]|uniref:Cytochrome P450 n=1 Tax=Ophiocordyceps australis TaxID=1399860 RepID=A0A2C5XXV0_9HYPO|nr:hypothetical protein CDD81_2586 [Ophiocordyceps australis]